MAVRVGADQRLQRALRGNWSIAANLSDITAGITRVGDTAVGTGLRPAGVRRRDYVIWSWQVQLPVFSDGVLLLGALSFAFSDSYQALHSLSETFPLSSESSFPH